MMTATIRPFVVVGHWDSQSCLDDHAHSLACVRGLYAKERNHQAYNNTTGAGRVCIIASVTDGNTDSNRVTGTCSTRPRV